MKRLLSDDQWAAMGPRLRTAIDEVAETGVPCATGIERITDATVGDVVVMLIVPAQVFHEMGLDAWMRERFGPQSRSDYVNLPKKKVRP